MTEQKQYSLKDIPEDIKENALKILNHYTHGIYYFELNLAIVAKDDYFRLLKNVDNSKDSLIKKIEELGNKLKRIEKIIQQGEK